eukprot:3328683-Rhodomonas_salina.1
MMTQLAERMSADVASAKSTDIIEVLFACSEDVGSASVPRRLYEVLLRGFAHTDVRMLLLQRYAPTDTGDAPAGANKLKGRPYGCKIGRILQV